MFKQCSKCPVLIWIIINNNNDNNNDNNNSYDLTLLHPRQLFVKYSLNVYVCCKLYNIKDCSAVLKLETDFVSLLCVCLQYCLCLCLLQCSFGDDCIALE